MILAAATPHLPGVLHNLEPALNSAGYLAVFGFVLLEDFGVPVPGETILILGAVYAGAGRLSIFLVGLLAFIGAIIGDNIGFTIGHFGGRPLVERWGRYIFLTPERLDKATGFFERHGGKIVAVARFIEGLRQANGIIAGITGMHWAKFVVFNAIGAALWVAVWTCVGYFSGNHIDSIYNTATKYSTYLAIAAGVLIVAFIARAVIRHRRRKATAAGAGGTAEAGAARGASGANAASAPESDLSPARIKAAMDKIDRVFLHTPQFVSDELSQAFGREVVVKDETKTPIGSFKGRGTWLLSEQLDPAQTWVCSTAGNFGQGVAYAARAHEATAEVFVGRDVPAAKVSALRDLGARVHMVDDAPLEAREHSQASDDRLLVVDGLRPEVAEGAGTIGLELQASGPIDVAVIQIGDGALASGVAAWLKDVNPRTHIVGVCASGAPAMAQSFAAGHRVSTSATNTIATALAISEPIPESLARVRALVDEILLVDDDDLRAAQALIRDKLGVAVEPAGAAGVAALTRHGARIPKGRTAVLLTGAGSP